MPAASTSKRTAPPAPPDVHPVTAYAQAVIAGEIVAGRLVRLACERHLRDLATGHERGLWFDGEAASWAIQFFGYLKQSKGEWAGKPLTLQPWQAFIIGSLFGWRRADGTRRFRTAYDEIPRKNGKSTVAAGVGLLLAFFDNEGGAEVYAAATKRDQARIVWEEAKRMTQATEQLRKRIRVFAHNLHQEATASKFEPLGADEDGTDGLNIHGAIIDELHAHKSRAMWDVLETATGARRQPLTFVITTAGYDRHSVCWEQHEYAIKVLEGIVEDDSYFAYIATIDEGDDWTDESAWAKANPNLGVSVKLDKLREECAQARQMPGKQNAFKRLHLNIWTEQAERWIDTELWDAQAERADPDDLAGRDCYAGLDLSTTTDITALELWFPDDDGSGGDLLSFFWVPAENMRQRAEKDRVPYPAWAKEGFIEPTPGDVVDQDFIRRRVNELGQRYNIREIAIDRWNAAQLTTQLMGDGFTVVPFGQGFASMSAPTKELERLLRVKGIRHGGNKVLRWMASNVAVQQDAAGNLKPAKDRSTERIDGIVAMVMAIGRASVQTKATTKSVYEERGVVRL